MQEEINKDTFENNLYKLEAIVSELDSSNISLDEQLQKYEEGMNLSIKLKTFLDEAEQKVIEISKSNEDKTNQEKIPDDEYISDDANDELPLDEDNELDF
jgi:exodeoxyribonuclease VII small subunit